MLSTGLKKYLKFTEKHVKSGAGKLALETTFKSVLQYLFGPSIGPRISDYIF
ncbi:hypothetical protein ACEZ3G_16745 [Maribacter algicola]|uniref:Uncharacterized protein n=1 Tax=Meishania litoralis TaxID=3434685 RepID=A0ACC7LMY8_9FLAO